MLQAPLVVGYKGEIGRFILACLLEDMPKANDILCVDINNSDEDLLERIEKTDSIFLCVPLQATEAWLQRYHGALKGKLIVEQSSMKAFLYENPRFADLRFLSMHLLFRPSATPVEDRRGLVFADRLPCETVQEFDEIAKRVFKTKFEILESDSGKTYQLHDRLMARHQALVHRVLLVLADSLDDAGVRTFVGQRVVELADRIRGGDATLYRMIQENPHLASEMESFLEHLRGFTPD